MATNSQITDLAFEDLYGVHAIDEKQQLERTAGYGIISGGEVAASGADSYTVSVTEAVGQFGFASGEPDTVTAPAADKDLLPYVDDTKPRKVLICLQDTGSIVVIAGEPEEARPESALETNETGETPAYFKTERPAPPDLLGRGDVLPLARIWLGANATEIKPEHIRPSRVAVDITTRSIRGETADFSVFDDGAGVSHTGELADAGDIRADSEIKSVINDDPYHSENADHDYWTASDTLSTVNGEDVLTVSISGDADTVDGYHATELSKTGHNHDARYLLDQSGTVTVSNLAFDPFTQAEYEESLHEVVATVPITLVGGQLQAAKETITGVQSAVDSDFDVEVNLTGDPGFDAGYTYEWDRTWDTSEGTWTVEVVVTWADTPVGGSDADAEIRIVERGDSATPLSVEGESINPRSIGQQTPTEAITAENIEVRGDVVSQSTDTRKLSGIADHITEAGEDLQTLFANDVAAGETAVIGPGNYIASLTSTSGGHVLEIGSDDITVVFHPDATIALENGELSSSTDTGRLISIADGVSGTTIKGRGTLDGNKANQATLDSPTQFGLVKFGQAVANTVISGLELRESPGDAIRPVGASNGRISDVRIENVRILSCAEGIVFDHTEGLTLTDFYIENMTAEDAVEPGVGSTDWVISDFVIDTTTQSGIDVFQGASHGHIANGIIRDPAQGGSEAGIGIGGQSAAVSGDYPIEDVTVADVTVLNSGNIGVIVRGGDDHEGIKLSNCRVIGSAGTGINVAAGVVNLDNCDAVANETDGLNHQGHDSDVTGGTYKNNDQSGGGNDAIVVNGPDITVSGAHAYDDQGTATQRIGVRVAGGATLPTVIRDVTAHGNDLDDIRDGGDVAVVSGGAVEDLGTSPTSAPTGAWPDGTTVRNSNSDNNETWRLVKGTWVQTV